MRERQSPTHIQCCFPATRVFDDTEFYGELNIPLLSGVAGADYVEVNLAASASDYSTSGSESTYKASTLRGHNGKRVGARIVFDGFQSAGHRRDYKERTTNPDGSISVNDLSGRHTDETFARAFPDLRLNTTVDWMRDRWSGSLVFRWTDDMTLDDGSNLDSAMFTDLRASYNPPILDDALTVSLGFNNVFEEDPSFCTACGVIGLSTVSHDLPGRVGYLRVTYEPR